MLAMVSRSSICMRRKDRPTAFLTFFGAFTPRRASEKAAASFAGNRSFAAARMAAFAAAILGTMEEGFSPEARRVSRNAVKVVRVPRSLAQLLGEGEVGSGRICVLASENA